MFEYQGLINELPPEEVNSHIKRMMDNYDLTGDFYSKDEGGFILIINKETYFKKHYTLSETFYKCLQSFVEKEFDNEKYKLKSNGNSLEFIDFDLLDSPSPEKDLKNKIKDKIFCSLLDYLESQARKNIKERENLRIPVGNTVEFNDCLLSNSYLDKVEFYKDGGWGIAEKDGTVIVKNHLKIQISKTDTILKSTTFINTSYKIIQDSDTNRFGILSINPFYEIIHCRYDFIKVVDFGYGSSRHYYFVVYKGEKCGCCNEHFELIIECKYDDIHFVGNNIEGRCLDKFYLYNKEGILLLGGYNFLEYELGDIFKFYFWKDSNETIMHSNPYLELNNNINKSTSFSNNIICLILDSNFKSIIKYQDEYYKLKRGRIFNSFKELSLIPSEILFYNKVNLSDLNEGFVYSILEGGDNSVISEYIDALDARPSLGGFPAMASHWEDFLIEDNLILVTSLSNDGKIRWKTYINEFGKTYSGRHLFRRGALCGFYNNDGLCDYLFNAITVDTPDDNTYIAKINRKGRKLMGNTTNPNYVYDKEYAIEYYCISPNGEYKIIEDNWKIFCPLDHKWFPSNFKQDNGLIREFFGSNSSYHDNSTDWTDEDAWDAMTDGMYGDYPGPGWDPELLGL